MALRLSFRLACLLVLFALYSVGSCAQSAPAISSVGPPLGPAGTLITITGQNFGATQGTATVRFGTVVASPSSWSNTQIVVPVPSTAPNGATTIYVTTAAGTSNGIYFLIGQNPLLSGISPPLGPAGTAITLTGLRFGATQGSSTVMFGTVVAAPTSWSDTQIVVPVPSAAPNGGTQIYVTTSAGNSNSLYFAVGALPTISSVSLPLGPPGTSVTIAGIRFGATQGASTVKFGTIAAPITSWSDTQIVTAVPSTAPNGGTQISVTTSVGTGNSVYFVVGFNPLISSISLQQAPAGTPVTIGGLRFGATQGGGSVTFSGVSATPTSWNDTQIVALVPLGASGAAFLRVTTANGTSNAWYFNVTGPQISSISPSTASPGATVTINGSGFGATQGSSSVKFNGTSATITSWSANSISATVPQGATSGNVIATVSSIASNGANFTVAAPPTITASAFPPPNASGWNTTSVYVTFTCTAGGFPIATCPAQQVVSTDGASQIITGTATDTSGGTASASVTLNVERTPPALAISSPADQDSSTSATLSVAGTASNSVTNINSISCNGTTAATSAGAFSCNLSLNPGVNLVMVRATDVAGNISAVRLHVTYAAALPAPASLQIGPASANVLVGATQQFTAVDEFGRPRTDATWTVDNTSVATITADASPTLTGVAAGTVTLTASVGSATTQIQVNILAGTSLPVGTVLWSAPSTPGFTVVQIAQAVPTANGPDLFSIERGSFTTSQVRALTSDGRPMWTAPISGNTARGLSATPDGSGGLLVHLSPQTGVGTLMDIDGQSGAVVWQRADSSTASGTKGTIGQDGTIYLADATFSPSPQFLNSTIEQLSIVGVDPATGVARFNFPIPLSTVTNGGITYTPDPSQGPNSSVSQPIIGPDGSLFAEVLAVNKPVVDSSYNQTLSLLQATPGGAATLTTIAEVDWSGSGPIPFAAPIGQIPDGSGGIFASWYTTTGSTLVNHISHITSTGVIDSTPSFQNPILPDGMVDGESATLFATDGLSVSSFTSSLSPNWTYMPSGLTSLSILTSTAEGGAAIKSSDPNGTDTVIRLDSNGLATADSWSARSIDYVSERIFSGIALSSTLAAFAGTDPQEAAAPSSRRLGDGQHNGTEDPGLVLVGTQDCHKSNAQGTLFARYPTYKLRLPTNTSSPPSQNYTVFEYVKEDHSADNCNLGFGHVNPCQYADGSSQFPYNDFSDEISSGANNEEFLRTQFFLYGLPKQRMFFVRKIYRTLQDGSRAAKSPIFNKIQAIPGTDPLIDGHPDPWFAPWDGTPASCDSSNSTYFPTP